MHVDHGQSGRGPVSFKRVYRRAIDRKCNDVAGAVTGFADLTSVNLIEIGLASTGIGRASFALTGGDVTVLALNPFGDLAEFVVGSNGSGNGSATGVATITDGDLNVSGFVIVGNSSGATAQGNLSVTNGDIVVEEGDDVSTLGIGTAIFDGADATGTLTVNQGSITARRILVGIPNLARNQSPIVNGTLIVNEGDINVSTMEIGANGVVAASGASSLNGRPVTGRLQQFGGIAKGQSLMLGELVEIVLGIGGPSAGDDDAQIQVEDATLDGLIELRFVDGYEPQPGDVFDLIDANEFSGDYTVVATGLDPQRLANLEVNEVGSQNGLMLTLVVVPEPDRATLFLCAICGFITSRRSEVRRASSFEGPVEQQL